MKKICIITGANAGIGKQAAIQIATKDYKVILGCRNKERGEVALEEIKRISGSEDIELMVVDMSLKSSITNFVEAVKSKYDTIDVLIHNAAVFDISQKSTIQTSEGYESIWMTNHIGPVLLTRSLIELLKRSDDPRVITIASKGLLAMPSLKVDLEDPEFKTRKFSVTKAYYQAKRAQIMYTYWLAKEYKKDGIHSNAIRVTAVKIDIARHPNLSAFMKWVYSLKSKQSIEPSKMAETYSYLATSGEVKGVTGKYYDEHNQQVKSNRYTYDLKHIDNVMKLTEKYL